jgi:hypothetical protein
LGFSTRLSVFFERGLLVMMIDGPAGSCERVVDAVGVGRELGGR